MYVLDYGQCSKPYVRERARVTMVFRLCARVERSVLFRIEELSCWLGSPSEPLAVADWISKLTWVPLLSLYCGQYREPYVHDRARVTMVTGLRARA